MADAMDILVVGAGIGGLAAALALARDGHRVTVMEQTPEFAAVGAGITLAPNAVHGLASLGVDVPSAGEQLHRTELRSAGGGLLSAVDLEALARRHGPTYGVPRPALHAQLTAALPDTVDVALGSRVEDVLEDGDGVWVDRDGVAARFDVVIGADGLRSALRSHLAPGHGLRYSGTTCWRGIAQLPVRGGTAVEAWGSGTRVGVVPVGNQQVYYYLVRSAPAGAPALSWPEGFLAAFVGYGGVAGQLLDSLDSAPPLHHDLIELDAPCWGTRRVLLLGDAAHAMTPNQGQGAAMAIEDAVALAQSLRPGIVGALDRYRATRDRRVRKVQLSSRRIGTVAHWQAPGLPRMRDLGLRLTPRPAAARAMRRLVEPGVALVGPLAPRG